MRCASCTPDYCACADFYGGRLKYWKGEMMTKTQGKAFLLKLSDDAPTPTFRILAGLRTTSLSINTVDDGPATVSLEASGIFLGSEAERKLQGIALSGDPADYELSFEGGEKMRGKFLVKRLDYAGNFNGERNYTLSLQSVDPVVQS